MQLKNSQSSTVNKRISTGSSPALHSKEILGRSLIDPGAILSSGGLALLFCADDLFFLGVKTVPEKEECNPFFLSIHSLKVIR